MQFRLQWKNWKQVSFVQMCMNNVNLWNITIRWENKINLKYQVDRIKCEWTFCLYCKHFVSILHSFKFWISLFKIISIFVTNLCRMVTFVTILLRNGPWILHLSGFKYHIKFIIKSFGVYWVKIGNRYSKYYAVLCVTSVTLDLVKHFCCYNWRCFKRWNSERGKTIKKLKGSIFNIDISIFTV